MKNYDDMRQAVEDGDYEKAALAAADLALSIRSEAGQAYSQMAQVYATLHLANRTRPPDVAEGIAETLEDLAQQLADMRACHDVAESAAGVPGESGRQEAIGAWECVQEEPDVWLREQAAAWRADR